MAASRNSRSPDLQHPTAPQLAHHLLQRLAELLGEGAGAAPSPASPLSSPLLAVGLSGGRDSVALLSVLAEAVPSRGWRLVAVHVHHGLSPHADAWADFCGGLCEGLGVPLVLARVRVEAGSGEGLEAAARRARYAVFADLDADALILGHHREDQAETLLFNLLRGSGLRGLAAMPARRLLARSGKAPLPLLRPLLDTPRADIEAFLQHRGCTWIEDESNQDPAYSRNFLRHRIMPLLEARFPAAASLARTARLAGEAEALLEEMAADDLAAALVDGHLPSAALAGLSSPRRRNLLRHWLRQAGAPMPDFQALAELEKQLSCPRADGQVEWRCGQWVVRNWRGVVFLDHEPLEAASFLDSRPWQAERPVSWASWRIVSRQVLGQGIGAAFLAEAAAFCPRQGGENLRLPGRPNRPLKKLLQEAHVPPWQRQRLPLLWIGSRLAWVPGLGVAAEFCCGPDEPGWVLELAPEKVPG